MAEESTLLIVKPDGVRRGLVGEVLRRAEDKGLRLASGRKMGIFETGDMVGLDVTYGALMAMYRETGDPRFYPPLLLRRKVRAGQLGRKTGKGWYEYDEKGNRKPSVG